MSKTYNNDNFKISVKQIYNGGTIKSKTTGKEYKYYKMYLPKELGRTETTFWTIYEWNIKNLKVNTDPNNDHEFEMVNFKETFKLPEKNNDNLEKEYAYISVPKDKEISETEVINNEELGNAKQYFNTKLSGDSSRRTETIKFINELAYDNARAYREKIAKDEQTINSVYRNKNNEIDWNEVNKINKDTEKEQ